MSDNNYSILNGNIPESKMSFDQQLLLSLLIVIIGVPMLLFGLFLLSLANMQSEQEVASNITLTSTWTEITPRRPLKPSKQFHDVTLVVEEPLTKSNLDLEHVKLEDGTVIHLEIQLVDQFGNVFVADVGQNATPSPIGNSVGGYVSDLPRDRSYTKVRIRSDRPLKVSRVVWFCWDGK